MTIIKFRKFTLAKNPIIREILSEFLGTFLLVLFLVGLGCQNVLSYGTAGSSLSGSLGTAFAVMMALQVSGKVSGAHINPIVTFAFAIIGRCPWWKVLPYMLSQYVAGFCGAAIAYFVYKDALFAYNGDIYGYTTASMYTSFPQPFVPLWNAFFDTLVGAALLMALILAIADQKNMKVQPGFAPLVFGFMIFCISTSLSYNNGNPINPARDFSPRLFLMAAGWGTKVLYGPNYCWWWIPLVASHVGAVIGSFVYLLLIEIHHPDDDGETHKKLLSKDGTSEVTPPS
ncbi:Aquaporin-10 [Chamberlinius hualienensis]